MPNLEPPECLQSRTAVKQFYSNHFGNEMKTLAENPEMLENFITPELQDDLAKQPESAMDYFTQTADYPKAFRVGGCEVLSNEKTNFEVLLFWRDENRSEQREIFVEVLKKDNSWLINKVSSK